MKTRDGRTAAQRGRGPTWRLAAVIFSTFAIMGTDRSCCRPDEFPTVRKDDSGNTAWVRQVVPILLGRKVKGYEELKFLTDLVASTDRPTVIRALMQQPGFREHWSEVLIDQLRVDREGPKSSGPPDPCYGPPQRSGAPAPDLAQHILANPPTAAAPGGTFNMSDVVQSALALDNLAPLYKAHLFALEHRPLYPFDDPQVREDLGHTFDETYLNRQLSCLVCHNSDSSTTGPASGWTRFFPIQGSFEKALYGANTGISPDRAHAMFRVDQYSDTSTTGHAAPWSMSGCGYFKDTIAGATDLPYFTGSLPSGATVTTLAALFTQGYQGLTSHGLGRSLPSELQAPCNLCQTSCSGSSPADPGTATNGAFVQTTLISTEGPSNGCGNCHGSYANLWFTGSADPWYAHLLNVSSSYGGLRVNPGNAASSVLIKKLRGDPSTGQRMPQGGPYLLEADIQKFEAWINSLPAATACANCTSLNCDPTVVAGNEAFAYLTAERIVDVVWQEAMGYRLTIANYFPRNYEQRQTLWNLTEHVFLPHHWSLQELLVAILTSDLFSRHAPAHLAAGMQPYELPMIYDPWVAADPRGPPVTTPGYRIQDHPDTWHNAMTDGIYRYSARSLLASAHQALDWPAPQRFPSNSGYPDQTLEETIGQYFSGSNPGFRSTNFQALLHWESVLGHCANQRPDASPDWISRVTVAAASFTPPSGEGPLTLRDLIVLERDWLLSDGTVGTTAPSGLTQSEESSLAAFLGAPLSTSISSLQPAALESKLRGTCGVLLESPQFLLAGVVPEGAGPRPRLRVCNGAPCSYLELCNDLADKVSVPGRRLVCGDGTVSLALDVGAWGVDRFCPLGICRFVGVPVNETLRNPRLRLQPPACDPRCARIDCCGGPLPPPEKEQNGVFLAWADGAQVTKAEGVTLLRGGDHQPLKPGEKVAYGDLLEVPPTAILELETPAGTLASAPAPGGQQKLAPRRMLITGEQALKDQQKIHTEPPLSKQQLEWIQTKGAHLAPDGSRLPVKLDPSRRGPGETEKHWPQPLQPSPAELKKLQSRPAR